MIQTRRIDVDWFKKPKYMTVRVTSKKKLDIPDNLVTRCPGCSEIILNKDIENAQRTCPKCNHHFQMPARERILFLADPDSFRETSGRIQAADPLAFPGYRDKVVKGKKQTGNLDSVIAGFCTMGGIPVGLAATDFRFMGGSMGSVLGEEIAALIEKAVERKNPVVIVSASGGGARMQEGIISLMQMAKTSAALARLAAAKQMFISVLTDPTGGGVTASFAMLGDVIIAEPNALIMFAGPRVIEQTIRQHLPKRFQRAEFLQEHGMIDIIVRRQEMRDRLIQLLSITQPVPAQE
jgi:acetyl-CoA carboxylase carboxyl transferase subunit beta